MSGGPSIPTGSYASAVFSREVRDLADLGNASRWVGERWELTGEGYLPGLVGKELRSPLGERFTCLAAVSLNGDGLLAESSQRSLKSPDCLFAGRDQAGRVVLQPGDFKFSLDVAARQQIDPPAIRSLLVGGGPRFRQLLHGLLGDLQGSGAPDEVAHRFLELLDRGEARLLAGLFLSPDEPANRRYLANGARRGRGPREADVMLLPVGVDFYATLPGAEAAAILAEVDQQATPLRDFAAATYYYQLSAAVHGSFATLLRPILPQLGPEPEPDSARRLRARLARRPAAWAYEVTRDLAAPAIERRERLRLAHRLAGMPLYGRLAQAVLDELGLVVGEARARTSLGREEWKDLLRAVDERHAVRRDARLALAFAAGPPADDGQVLGWLRDQRPDFEAAARADLLELIADRVA